MPAKKYYSPGQVEKIMETPKCPECSETVTTWGEDGKATVCKECKEYKKPVSSSRITVRKRVFWVAAGKSREGIVKQIMSDHVLVEASDGTMIMVRKAELSTTPMTKKAGTRAVIITG